ncbi:MULTISPECIES: TIGR02594 family protein [Rhizobium/Agrobacterium group]|uniref:TIGR02594 family protein n=1 Tax=Rhizobium/Agrobacterium group TaxID=227290 RepID=UPI00110DAE1C|nr:MULTISPECIES: TIGR02594 family protein [Rhizobium/Agrobacterium group]NWJ22858.1 TIGR02594 family protein [Rhizobium sp. RM]TMV12244.1 TIGR02594 family protein [Rhizobium sp. Td3]
MKVSALFLAAVVSLTAAASASAGMLNQAERYSGLHETKNNKSLKNILGANPRVTPWCGLFLHAVASKAGRQSPKSYGFAKSWTSFGYAVPVGQAKPGDVVVVRNGRGYHAGILKSMSGKTAKILGGNQSGRVQVSNFSRKSIVSVRR